MKECNKRLNLSTTQNKRTVRQDGPLEKNSPELYHRREETTLKNIRLLKLSLQNFKGIKDFTLHAEGANMSIYGDNATGKTSIADAFIWLLFDKDTQNKKDFGIKTLVNGEEVHNLEHAVEALFTIDGSPMSLKKVYKEKWTKKRGSTSKDFTGHETDYYVDDVPVKKGEYADKVSGLMDENIFKLITSPTFFNEQVKWQDRRKTLLEICGDIAEEDVFASNNKLQKLPAILNGKSVDDYKKIVAQKRKKINEELDMIPVRISEVSNSLAELDSTPDALNKELETINGQIEETEEIIRNIKNGQALQDKKNELKNLQHDMELYKRSFGYEAQDQLNRLRVKRQEIDGNVSINNRQFNINNGEIKELHQRIDRLNETMDRLRNEYIQVNASQFEAHDATTCPTCKQDLPSEEVQRAHDEALAQFNENKSARLATIQAEGKSLAAEKLKLEGRIDTLKQELVELGEKLDGHQKEHEKVDAEILKAQNSAPTIETDAKYKEFLAKSDELNRAISDIQNSVLDSLEGVQEELSNQKRAKSDIESKLAAHRQAERSQQRIAELEEQQQNLAKEYEELELHLHLTEEYTRAKVNLLEEKINGKFKFARFKLFNTQINGGLEETCETIFDGVPYGAGLNNAARINVGIDIINTLTEYYGIRAPIFIDNAESVTRLIDSDSQIVSLVVSEPDKELRVEELK